jgi:histidinol dehydrogenase
MSLPLLRTFIPPYNSPDMIPLLHLNIPAENARALKLLDDLRLSPVSAILENGIRAEQSKAVRHIMADVAQRGDAALVDSARKFDDPNFSADRLKITQSEMAAAASRLPSDQLAALRRSISQVRQYQTHMLPTAASPLIRPGVELGMRWTPLDSVGLLIPGGKAAYPSSVIMLAVPAQVAGVKRIAVCSPSSQFGQSDIVLATYHELGLTEVFRAGGAAAVAALAIGTATIKPVDKLLGPGNVYVQLAKQLVAGSVGVDGFLGPSEILTLADETARPDFVAADLLAQAEHDPGSCYLLTDSEKLASDVIEQIKKQITTLKRKDAIEKALANHSAVLIAPMDDLIDWANRFAAEHVSLQTKNNDAVLAKLNHAGAIFVGPYSPVAAGDYIAGPSHCLPTNTTARFASGVSVYEFLKRSSIEKYDAKGLASDAAAIITLANAEHLDGHAASVEIRTK